jgi:SAM-dependent methyltransferase
LYNDDDDQRNEEDYWLEELLFSQFEEAHLLANGFLLEDAMVAELQQGGDEFDEPGIFLDVPFVPSDEKMISAMLELAGVTSKDLVYDLGCGDGRIIVAAAMERNARGIGIDLDPARIAEAMEYAADSRVEHMVDFLEGDLLEADFSEASVVFLYLLDSVNLELRKRLQRELRPGTRVVSHAFDMGDWKADEHRRVPGTNLYTWVIPAQLAGDWQWQDAQGRQYRLRLKQQHQKLKGEVRVDGEAAELCAALIRGELFEAQVRLPAADRPLSFVMRYHNGELVPHNKQLQPAPATAVLEPRPD